MRPVNQGVTVEQKEFFHVVQWLLGYFMNRAANFFGPVFVRKSKGMHPI